MKKVTLLIISISFFLTNCKNSHEKNQIKNSEEIIDETNYSETKNNFVLKIGKPYFEYDEIEFYSTNIDEDKAMDLHETHSNSSIEKLKFDIILNEFPENLDDTNFVNKLKDIGFKKSEIKSSDYEKINQIFVEKNAVENLAYACIAVYRDILVFKNKGKIIGIAKICFSCNQNHIVGTKANIENFGQDGDYEKLGNILKQY